MAIALFTYMVKKGCKPNTITYYIVINYLCEDRLFDHALGLLFDMIYKGILLDVLDMITYELL